MLIGMIVVAKELKEAQNYEAIIKVIAFSSNQALYTGILILTVRFFYRNYTLISGTGAVVKLIT